jgi:hypothetical protein
MIKWGIPQYQIQIVTGKKLRFESKLCQYSRKSNCSIQATLGQESLINHNSPFWRKAKQFRQKYIFKH